MYMHEAQAALSNGDLYPSLFSSPSVLVNVYTVTPDLRPVNHKVSRKKPRTEASKVRLVVIAGWKKTIKESERARYRRARQLGGSLFRLDPLERSEATWSCTLDVFSLSLSLSLRLLVSGGGTRSPWKRREMYSYLFTEAELESFLLECQQWLQIYSAGQTVY